MNLFTQNSPYCHLLKYVLFLLKHLVYQILWIYKPMFCFTPVYFQQFCFKAPYQFTQLLNLRPPVSSLTSFCCFTGTELSFQWEYHFSLMPTFQEHDQGIQQCVGLCQQCVCVCVCVQRCAVIHALHNKTECSALKELERQDKYIVLHSAVTSRTDRIVWAVQSTAVEEC